MCNKTREKQIRGKWLALGAVALSLTMTARIAIAGAEDDTVQAESEFAKGNLVAALALWRKAADQGYAPAQARLGEMYDKAEDDKEAVEWYRKSAAQGSAAGEYGLGVMYAKGEGVEKDPEQAFSYISRAAEKEYLLAMILMRELYRAGELGIAVDPVKAAEWEAKVKQAEAKKKETSPTTADAQPVNQSKK